MTRRRTKGEGSIFKNKKGYYTAKITYPNGTRKEKTAKSLSEAREWLLEQRKAVQDGMIVLSDKMTVSQFLDHFLRDVVQSTLEPKTVQDYTGIINRHLKPELGFLKLTALRPLHLQSLYTKKVGEKYSRRTVEYIHAVLHRALQMALKWGLVVRNVADVVDAPRPEKKAPKAMNREQANRFLEIVRGDRFYPIYLLAIATGARQGELLGLHWPDVDLAACTIAIKYTVQEIRGQGLIVKEPKTDTSRRQISVPPVVVAALLEHKRRQAGVREKGLAAGVWQEQGFVFTTGSGNPVSPRNLQRHFHLVLKRNDLPRLPFHALRHTSASPLLAENVHPKVVQEMLGHSRIDMTLDTYSHVIPGMHRGAADKMESILGGG